MLSTREVHFFGPRLRAIGVTSVDHNLCDQEYEPFGGLTERMFCVHTNTPTESLCNVRKSRSLVVGVAKICIISG